MLIIAYFLYILHTFLPPTEGNNIILSCFIWEHMFLNIVKQAEDWNGMEMETQIIFNIIPTQQEHCNPLLLHFYNMLIWWVLNADVQLQNLHPY